MKFLLSFCSICIATLSFGQKTFKCGWNTYRLATLHHSYSYSCSTKDSVKLFLIDSTVTSVAADSAVVFTVNYPARQRFVFKTACYYSKHLLSKQEEYKDDNLQEYTEYRYNSEGKVSQTERNDKLTGNVYKKTYDYTTDKQTGEQVTLEVAYLNGRIEFYTKFYYKDGKRTKEVRLNDNNKDVLHIENYYYHASGKLKERSVYFPEWKTTKRFTENVYDDPAKCFRISGINIPDKFSNNTRIGFTKKVLSKNMAMITDPECHDYKYTFRGKDIEIVVCDAKVNSLKKVDITFTEKF